jgi:hypothetical protein
LRGEETNQEDGISDDEEGGEDEEELSEREAIKG